MENILAAHKSVWDFFKNSQKPVILYGMGDGADKVIKAFEKYNISVSGVMASDDFVRGQSFHGFTVKKLGDFEKEFDDFCVALCFASSLDNVMANIKRVSAMHPLRVPSVPAFGSVIFDDDFVQKYSEKIHGAYSLFADEQSKSVYKNTLKFYYTGELSLLDEITTDKDEAFNTILRLGKNESYLDLGAYNGDTIEEFLHYTGGEYKDITALEPNAKNFKKLEKFCGGMKNVNIHMLGAYSKNTELDFNNKAGRNSAIADSGVKTRVMATDSLLCGKSVSYIKADVEGADTEVILGMKNTLKNFKPKLNFSAYHRFEDIFRLPQLIHGINPDYKIYLRHHPYIPAWDTNLYCV